MKKRILITLFIALTVLLLCATAAALFSASEYTFTRCKCITSPNGDLLMVEGRSPIVMSNRTKAEDIFHDLSDGDEILVLHDAVQESYPGRTGVYFVKKLSDGEITDIPEDVLITLTELGWYEVGDTVTHSGTKEYPQKVEFSTTDIEWGYDHDAPSPRIDLITSEKELSDFRESQKNEYVIAESVVDLYECYDEDFFKKSYLAVIYNSAHSGSVVRRVTDVTFEADGKLNIIIEDYCPEVFTDDCSGWTHFIEIDRGHMAEGMEDINVEFKPLDSFSYDDDIFYLTSDTLGVRTSGFVNTKESPITCPEDAIRLAKAEVSVTYKDISVAYDLYSDMWRVSFYTKGVDGSCQDIYMTSSGITKMSISGE